MIALFHRRGGEGDIGVLGISALLRRSYDGLFAACSNGCKAVVKFNPPDGPSHVFIRPIIKHHWPPRVDQRHRTRAEVPAIPRIWSRVKRRLSEYPRASKTFRRGDADLRLVFVRVLKKQAPDTVRSVHDSRFLGVAKICRIAEDTAPLAQLSDVGAGRIQQLSGQRLLIPARVVDMVRVILGGKRGILATVAIIFLGPGAMAGCSSNAKCGPDTPDP